MSKTNKKPVAGHGGLPCRAGDLRLGSWRFNQPLGAPSQGALGAGQFADKRPVINEDSIALGAYDHAWRFQRRRHCVGSNISFPAVGRRRSSRPWALAR